MHKSQNNNVDAYPDTQNLESTTPNPTSKTTDSDSESAAPARRSLPAGLWLRAVLDFDAPFGHDGMPTVWG